MERRGIVPARGAARLEVASRTDRGVSARANAFGLTSELPASALLRRLNTIAPEIFCTAASEVPADFRVRKPQRRVYRYFEPSPAGQDPAAEAALPLFQGRIDVRSFGRGLTTTGPVWREIESVTRRVHGPGSVLEVRAPSFVWGEVRKIVGAIREVAAGRLALPRLEAALQGRARLTLPMAEPDGLILWEVEYPVPWETWWSGPSRPQRALAQSAEASQQRRAAILDALRDRVDTVGPPPT